jgi:hypothetical protein
MQISAKFYSEFEANDENKWCLRIYFEYEVILICLDLLESELKKVVNTPTPAGSQRDWTVMCMHPPIDLIHTTCKTHIFCMYEYNLFKSPKITRRFHILGLTGIYMAKLTTPNQKYCFHKQWYQMHIFSAIFF